MADSALTLKLDDYTAAKIAERATAMGIAPEALAAMVLDARFFDYDDFTWTNADPTHDSSSTCELAEPGGVWSDVRSEGLAQTEKPPTGNGTGPVLTVPKGRTFPVTRPEDYDGPYIDADDAMDAFRAELERRLASCAG